MRGSRIPLWDNARFGCIVLVVMGHAIQRQTLDSDNALTLYLFIYAFHMPAFAIISGYFSKASPPGTRQMRRIITDFVLPYVIFEAIWGLVQFLVEGYPAFNPTEPSWTLWFLLALAIFRLVLPYLVLLRWPLAWAALLSVGVGYLANVDSTFSLSRAIGILPFFVLGWQLRQWKVIDRWRDLGAAVWGWRALAVAVFAGWLVVVALHVPTFREFGLKHWFFYDDSYLDLGEPVWWAGLLRLGLIVLAVVLSAAFFALIPRRETFFSAFGQATMYVYLLHSFVLYPLRESGVLRDDHASATWLLTMIFASTAIAIALSSPVVRRLFRPLVEPKPRWLFRVNDDRPDESRTDAVGARREGSGLKPSHHGYAALQSSWPRDRSGT
ncbi:acyltransferase family protein [Pseudolysinimonas yzui]|uniref:Membrane protein n=1 Tax=Pseudolysinimonas yzui TaxID=2708254 RepID=A0A8J3GNF2_9MICO|nr:acyltransferase family protein [Pseudolysinimonas yzui]GHF06824.1 membrane protein [Pseudolysinimonas yzui]